jgi:hypothetical protein
MDPFAIPADVAGIWRPLTDAETAVVTNRIAQASRRIRAEVPLVDGLTVDERIDFGTLDAALVKDVVVDMVKRLVSIPGYLRQRSVTVDDGTTSETYDSSVSGGELFISDREMDLLVGRRTSRSRAFTITPGPGPSWT